MGWVQTGETGFGKPGGFKQEKRTSSAYRRIICRQGLPEGKVVRRESASLLAATLSGETHFGKWGGCKQEKRDLANGVGLNRRNALLREPGWLLAGRVCKRGRLLGGKVHLSYWWESASLLFGEFDFPFGAEIQVVVVAEAALADGDGDFHEFVVVDDDFAFLGIAKGFVEENFF